MKYFGKIIVFGVGVFFMSFSLACADSEIKG